MFLQRFIQNIGYRQNCCKTFSSTTQIIMNEKVTRKKSRYKIDDDILSQLKKSNLEYFIDNIPSSIIFGKATKQPSLYLIDKNVAKQLTAMISKDLLQNPSYVIEFHPAFGLLTQELLDVGIPKINLFERIPSFLTTNSPLTKLLIKYESRLKLKKISFIEFWMTILKERFNLYEPSETYLADIPYRNWEDETFAQLIVVCADKEFLSLLIHNFFNCTKIFDHGRLSLFLVLPHQVWERMIRPDKTLKGGYYNQYNVMFNLFFDFTELGRVPRKSFIPRISKKSKIFSTNLDIDLVVVKIEPKKDAYSFLAKEDMEPFWYFLKGCMRSQNNKIIEEFEKLVSGCGPKLIKKNINICTRFIDLSPIEILELFKMLKSWPEYDKNMMKPNELIADEEKDEVDKLLSEEK